MKIKIFSLASGSSHDLEMEASDTAEYVKAKIQDAKIFEGGVDKMRLIYKGRHFEDGRTLADQNVQDGDELHLALKLAG